MVCVYNSWRQNLQTANWKHKGSTIVIYFGWLKKLCEELENYEQILICKCGNCTCNIELCLKRNVKKKECTNSLMLILTYTPCSVVHFTNSFSHINPSIFLFQSLRACLSTYKTLCNLYILVSWPYFITPPGCAT